MNPASSSFLKNSPIRVVGVALLALLAAIVVTLGAIQIRAWWGSNPGGAGPTTISDEEKLDILASLEATNTPSVKERSAVLEKLSAPTQTNQPSEEEKLKILQALQAKP